MCGRSLTLSAKPELTLPLYALPGARRDAADMTRKQSAYLDLLRVLAAFTVLLGHVALRRFSGDGYADFQSHAFASDAVAVFFVLSGFIMAYVTSERNRGAADYAFSRASRIFSVAVPALLLTLVADSIGMVRATEFYAEHVGATGGTPAETALRALTFSTHWWQSDMAPGSNSPWWSLSYEVSYYVLFGMFVFLRGWVRWVAIVAGLAVVGLNTLLLMPAFLMGVGLFKAVSRPDADTAAQKRSVVGAVVPVAVYAVLHMMNVPMLVNAVTAQTFEAGLGLKLGFSYNFVWALILGHLLCMHLRAMWSLLGSEGPTGRWAGWAKWLAGGSFSLYLVHFPVLHLLEATFPKIRPDLASYWLDDLATVAVTVAVCFAFAEVFERPLPRFRRALRRVGARSSISAADNTKMPAKGAGIG